MKLFAARHGETMDNANGVIQGHLPSELSDLGKQQAEQLAKDVSSIEPDIIFTSDLRRCLQTTKAIHKTLPGIPIMRDWRLRERYFGDLEGKHRDEVDWDGFWAALPDEEPHAAESNNHFLVRVSSFIIDLYESFDKVETAMVICHGGVLNKLRYLEKTKDFKPQHFDNARLYEFEIQKIYGCAKKLKN